MGSARSGELGLPWRPEACSPSSSARHAGMETHEQPTLLTTAGLVLPNQIHFIQIN